MSQVYFFKVSDKNRKSNWKQIEIVNTASLGHFDNIIRESFNHDTHDHLSEFHRGKVYTQTGYGEITPGGNGIGSKPRLEEIGLSIGDTLEYIYDYGSSVIKVVSLIDIKDLEPGKKYPFVSSQSRPRNYYCKDCRVNGLKVEAAFVVLYMETHKQAKLCSNCVKLLPKGSVLKHRIKD
jgi:hypothetical protein